MEHVRSGQTGYRKGIAADAVVLARRVTYMEARTALDAKMLEAALFALQFIVLQTSDGRTVEINPQLIVSIRAPRAGDHFAEGTKCLIFTNDGKFISVRNSCDEVREALVAAGH